MDVSAINQGVRAADLPLEKLAASTQLDDREKIAEVSRQFEAVLLRQILAQAQKPLFKSGLLESDNSTNSIYQDLITQQLADRISRGGSFGFAKVLDRQLAAQYIKKEQAEAKYGEKNSHSEPRTVVASHSSGFKSTDHDVARKIPPRTGKDL
jgi:flagellar protein FlgJ